jgi:hypothetical protein
VSQLKIYDLAAGVWRYVSSPSQMVNVSATAPSPPYNGELWWDTSDNSLLVDTVAPSVLAADPAFTGRYVSSTRRGGQWRRVAVQSIPNTTLTPISWDTEDFDSDNFLTPNATTGINASIPVGLTGTWAVTAQVTYAGAINVNQLQIINSLITDPFVFPGMAADGYQTASVIVQAASGSYFQIATKHANGAALNIARARFDMRWLGP